MRGLAAGEPGRRYNNMKEPEAVHRRIPHTRPNRHQKPAKDNISYSEMFP